MYLIFLEEPDSDAWNAAKDRWKDRICVADNHQVAFLFPAPAEEVTTKSIQSEVGINEARLGFVFKSSSPARMSGYYFSDIWEWLRTHAK